MIQIWDQEKKDTKILKTTELVITFEGKKTSLKLTYKQIKHQRSNKTSK